MSTELEILIEKIREKATKKTNREEDESFNVYDSCGGDFDDAYWIGCDDGAIYFARDILKEYNG